MSVTLSQIPVCYCLHDDYWYLDLSVRSFSCAGPIFAFISKAAWDGSVGDWEKCAEFAEGLGVEVILGEWPNEELHRKSALKALQEKGYSYVLTPDGDEIIEPDLLEALLSVASAGLADRVMCHFDTYWKSTEYVIRPREAIRPLMLVNLDKAQHVFCREYDGGKPLILGPEFGIVHHLSYCGPDERILRKISTWGHKDEVQNGWYTGVWQAWDADRLMGNLHPTHPPAYGWTERIIVPEILRKDDQAPTRSELSLGTTKWPKVSVAIPLYGGPDDIRLCLESLGKASDLLHEVVVVDDCSPDNAAESAEEVARNAFAAGDCRFKLLRNDENLGFAATSNAGYLASTGDVVLFLNSDTIVPRSGLIRLIESVTASGSVGAAGPHTNNCGYDQPISPTYTKLEHLDLFADDFAMRQVKDQDVPMLVGFCLAVRRSVIEEIGEPIGPHGVKVPFDTRFGRGLFEDNDLCYRILRAGYKIRIATRSYVHHGGSHSLNRIGIHPCALLEQNKSLFNAKWQTDVQCGFASHLSGQLSELISFNQDRHPDLLRARLRDMARRADISLCMIVRDEERVIGDCLASVKDVFRQVIVVDTGSTDRTKEIAREHGAEVYEMPWPDSFAAARNESLRYAKGNWIFWLDADDTLPLDSALAVLNAAITSPRDITGYVMPVQFVETESAGATRVDHLKLFRNLPGLQFEGRIHEQILGSLRLHGGNIARINGIVLHSGYDTSPEGQAKKRIRDEKLLKLDLDERPDHPFVLFNLGMTAHYCEDHEAAIEWLDKSLKVSRPEESHVRKIYALMGVSLRRVGKTGAAIDAFRHGLDVVGEDPEIRFQLAMTLVEVGHFADAKTQYLAIRTDYEDHFSSFDIGILGFKRYFNLASVCLQLDQYQEAKEWFRKAIASSAGRGRFEAAESFFHAAMSRHDFAVAKEALEAMQSAAGRSEAWLRYYLDLEAYRGGDPGAALDRLVREEPMEVAPRLFLARTLLERGMIGPAQRHLEFLDRIGCAEAAFYLGVCSTRDGDYTTALYFMQRAQDLNPGHEQTAKQVEILKQQLGVS